MPLLYFHNVNFKTTIPIFLTESIRHVIQPAHPLLEALRGRQSLVETLPEYYSSAAGHSSGYLIKQSICRLLAHVLKDIGLAAVTEHKCMYH